MAEMKLRHGIWVDIEGPGVTDGWRPRSVIESREHRGLFKIDEWLYNEDGTPAAKTPDAPRINLIFEQYEKTRDRGFNSYEGAKINPRHLFKR